MSCIERCPHFRGKFIAYLGYSKVVLISGVSFKRGSTAVLLMNKASALLRTVNCTVYPTAGLSLKNRFDGS